MTNDYTPTTEQVRDVFHLGAIGAAGGEANLDSAKALAMFDRWLTEHNAKLVIEFMEQPEFKAMLDGLAAAGVAPQAPSEPEHATHVTAQETYPSDCLEGECDHRDEDGEPFGMSACTSAPFEVCVECMVDAGYTADPENWEGTLLPWPCEKQRGEHGDL